MKWKLSPWFDMRTDKPVRKGFYRIQDLGMSCDCCWIDAHWDGKEWHTKTMEGVYRTCMFENHVKRWRGRVRK